MTTKIYRNYPVEKKTPRRTEEEFPPFIKRNEFVCVLHKQSNYVC